MLMDDEFIPFEPAIVSKYGPISRAAAAAAKALMRPQAVQSSAVFGDATISTPGMRRPVPAPSPVTPPWPPQYNGEHTWNSKIFLNNLEYTSFICKNKSLHVLKLFHFPFNFYSIAL